MEFGHFGFLRLRYGMTVGGVKGVEVTFVITLCLVFSTLRRCAQWIWSRAGEPADRRNLCGVRLLMDSRVTFAGAGGCGAASRWLWVCASARMTVLYFFKLSWLECGALLGSGAWQGICRLRRQ